MKKDVLRGGNPPDKGRDADSAAFPTGVAGSERGRDGHSTLQSRNVTVAGRRTSMRLEPAMWDALRAIARREGRSLHEICTMINDQRRESSLTAAIRVFTMAYYRAAATDEGHARAGHGRQTFGAIETQRTGHRGGSSNPV